MKFLWTAGALACSANVPDGHIPAAIRRITVQNLRPRRAIFVVTEYPEVETWHCHV